MEQEEKASPFASVGPQSGAQQEKQQSRQGHQFPDWDLMPPRMPVRGGNKG